MFIFYFVYNVLNIKALLVKALVLKKCNLFKYWLVEIYELLNYLKCCYVCFFVAQQCTASP